MLNKAKVLKELQQHVDALFIDISAEYDLARQSWQRIAADPDVAQKIIWCAVSYTLPLWQEPLGTVYDVQPETTTYTVIGVDGSQIYPDKHQGTTCCLVNIGLVSIAYGGGVAVPVRFLSEPYVLVQQEVAEQLVEYSVDSVNCHRQEREFLAAYEWCVQHADDMRDRETLILCDGSLIFWHLESKEQGVKLKYLTSYVALMQQMYERGMVMAGYISMPKSKDLVNLIRAELNNYRPVGDAANKLEHLVDAHVAQFFLQPYTRSIVFQSTQPITATYPEHLRPYFFYMHVGCEVVRIELPAWVARDEVLVERVSRLMLDQARKGNGYPVVLAEAHEQAVVKGPDREFFYHLIQKLGIDKQRKLSVSPKSLKKRGIGI